MQSLRQLFRIGHGPSSSHTLGPRRAAELFLSRNKTAPAFRVNLYSSLAATGRGHLTDVVLEQVFTGRKLTINWLPEESLPGHPNGMVLEALEVDDSVVDRQAVLSIGGGALRFVGQDLSRKESSPYPLTNMTDIIAWCDKEGSALWEYVEICEGPQIWEYLEKIWKVMVASLKRGLQREGKLPGPLGLARKAHLFHRKAQLFGRHFRNDGTLSAYAFAVSEENATGGEIVTAPTCGGAGVLPAILFYLKDLVSCDDGDVLKALATAGLVGNLVKTNASISGAEVGCQGEVGTACSMAAAAATQLYGGTIRQIEYAAEMGMEHHLGLTCDPVGGLVQIPCIERNAHAATRALSCCHFALLTDGTHKISFDEIIAVMDETGHALPSLYRETARGGMAKAYSNRKSCG